MFYYRRIHFTVYIVKCLKNLNNILDALSFLDGDGFASIEESCVAQITLNMQTFINSWHVAVSLGLPLCALVPFAQRPCLCFCLLHGIPLGKQNGGWQETANGSWSISYPRTPPTPTHCPKTTWVNYSCNVAGSRGKRDGASQSWNDPF